MSNARYRHIDGRTTDLGVLCDTFGCNCLKDYWLSPFDPARKFTRIEARVEMDVGGILERELQYIQRKALEDILRGPRARTPEIVPAPVLGNGLPMTTACPLCDWQELWTDWGAGYRAAATMRFERHTEKHLKLK